MTVVETPEQSQEEEWLRDLRSCDRAAQERLYGLLLRAARAEVARRARRRTAIVGPELDDLAHQAAADATVSVLAKLDSFRGESRFTTWAYAFVVFEVAGKLTRHFWARAEHHVDRDPDRRWELLPDRLGVSPEQAAQNAELLLAIRTAVETELTAYQRSVFVAVVLEGVPSDVVSERLGTNRNAVYKTVFDARRKIRAFLVAHEHVVDKGASQIR